MVYLIGQIILCLLVGTALGVAVGWLLQAAMQGRRLDEFRRRLDRQGEKLALTRRQLAEQTTKAEERLQSALRERDHRLSFLEGDLNTDVTEKLSDLEARYEAIVREKDEEIARLTRFSREIEPILAGMEQREAELRTVKLQYEKLLGDTKSETRPSLKERVAKPPTGGNRHQRDDLKRISGIGPVLERTLNELGVYRYAQIASWTNTDIEQVSKRLRTFPDRIRRDNWIDGARKQHELKYGEGG